MMTCTAREKLVVLAVVVFAGCSREATLTPAPEPALTPAARPSTPPPVKDPCLEKFEFFDDDGDRRVSPGEFEEHSTRYADPDVVFHLRDTDGDGFLSQAEFCSAWASTPSPAAGHES